MWEGKQLYHSLYQAIIIIKRYLTQSKQNMYSGLIFTTSMKTEHAISTLFERVNALYYKTDQNKNFYDHKKRSGQTVMEIGNTHTERGTCARNFFSHLLLFPRNISRTSVTYTCKVRVSFLSFIIPCY